MSEEKSWVKMDNPPGAEGQTLVVCLSERYRSNAMTANPNIPVYTREEVRKIKSGPHSGKRLTDLQRIKRVFPTSRVVEVN